MAEPLPPDAEVLVANFLRTYPTLIPIHGGRVGTRLSPDGIYPAIRISLVSSRITETPGEYLPEVQVEAWADDQQQASLLSRQVVAALGDVIGTYPEGQVSGHQIVFGPIYSSDPVSQRPRYLLDVLLLTYPPTSQ